jgi:hypothetical protein
MSCSGNGSPGTKTHLWVFQNWSRTRTHTVPVAFRPGNVTELVAAVEAAERDPNGVVRAVGTGWSYPDVAIAPEVTAAIQTDDLKNVLSGTDPASMATLLPFALKDVNRPPSARSFVHVEAGIKLQELNCRLDEMGLALETLGGSNGQSLAGAISTGTHGSDFDMRPLADLVQAIHLVGPGGQEWWIERSGPRAITDMQRMSQARDAGRLCRDIRIVYDDMLFNAVLVSVGRMGVVYSYVVEVVPAFLIKQEKRQSLPWEGASTFIRYYRDKGPFTTPRFIDVTVDPYKRACVITLRSPTTTADVSPEGGPAQGAFKFVCDIQAMNAVLMNIAALVPPMIAAATAAAIATVSPALLLIPGAFEIASTAAVTAATIGLVALSTAIAAAIAAPGHDLAQKLTSIVNTVVRLGRNDVVPALVEQMITSERDPNAEVVVGKSFRILTGQKACPALEAPGECLRQIDGFEFALDCSPGSEKLFGFMDDVFALTDEFLASNMPQVFGVSLRFVKETEALIGMQQFARTAHAEFFFLRGVQGAEDFEQRLYAIAKLHGAIPHWGLKHQVDAQEIERLYGSRLRDWRMALRQLIDAGRGKDRTFSTSFSVARGLEPAAPTEMTPDISYLVPLLLSG